MTRLAFARTDDGAALILALAFLSLFGVLVAAILFFADTNLRMTPVVRKNANELYAVDGAVEGAVNSIRYDPSQGLDGGPCPDFTLTGVNGTEVLVRCQGRPGSGVPGGDGVDPRTRPRKALLTLSTGLDGLKQNGGDGLNVQGDVFSNSNIKVLQLMTVKKGKVGALGDCDNGAKIEASGGVRCADTPGGPPDASEGRDPGYAKREPQAPPKRTVPPCGTSWVIQVPPGTYDGGALSTLTKTCDKKVIWFPPGVYYLDGGNWEIANKDVDVVGGTPKGWDPAAASPPPGGIPLPGGCDAEGPDGVQFVFGGTSQVDITRGRVQLCAQSSKTTQQIVVYGVKEDGGGYFRQTDIGHPFLSVQGDVRVSLVGTVYTPLGWVDLKLQSSTQAITRGLIANRLEAGVTGSANGGSVISVPDEFLPGDRKVLFKAYVCPNGGSCADADRIEKLRAVVKYADDGGDHPGKEVRVDSWNVL